MKLMPASKAASTHASARSRGTPPPKVSHEPRPISEMFRSLEPSCRYRICGSIVSKLAQMPSAPDRTLVRMAKAAPVQFACTDCSTVAGRWLGRCPGCGAFGTLIEEAAPARGARPAQARPLLRLGDVVAEESSRIPTGVDELDRVLGGGLVPASLVLVGGEPGVGKSTLL